MRGVVEKLRAEHIVDTFDCGKDELNRYLQRHALVNQQAGMAQTYVVAPNSNVLGYFSLAAGSVAHDAATDRVVKGVARHPIPAILLARLAVDRSQQGRGLGPALLKDALVRSVNAAETIGARVLLVHAMDETARSFYEHFEFEPSKSDPLHLLLLMKDIRTRLKR